MKYNIPTKVCIVVVLAIYNTCWSFLSYSEVAHYYDGQADTHMSRVFLDFHLQICIPQVPLKHRL